MLHDDSHRIKERFFQAIDELIKRKQLRGKKTFATRYELNWGNLYKTRKDDKLTIELAYLNWLVRDFNISARWLLTGEGEMFAKTKATT